ncbi:MAG: hypothetical protein WC546_01055 [Candidatus Omnitrophota bacterium]
MKVSYSFILALFSLIVFPSVFAQETITITTYYPVPSGVYQELRSQRMAIGSTYYDGVQHPWDTNGSIVTGEISQDADLVVEGNVGIGTTGTSGFQRRGHLYNVHGLEISGNEPSGVGIRLMNTNTGADAGTGIWWFGDNTDDAVFSMGLDRDQAGKQPFLWTVNNDLRIGTSDTSTSDDTVKMILKLNGDIGIGTNAPGTYDNQAVKLDVNGATAVDDIYLKNPKSGSARWASQGAVQIAIAVRKDLGRVQAVRGPDDAFVRINNKPAHPYSDGGTYSAHEMDGIGCNNAKGWYIVGCWSAMKNFSDNDLDLSEDGNGCITNDWDEGVNGTMTVTCIKAQ